MTPIPDDLTECRRRLAGLQDTLNAHAIVSVTDHRGIITYVNDRFCAISGYTREELLGQTHRRVKSGMHGPGFYDAMWATIASGATWQGEICNRRKDGSLYWVASTIVPFCDEHGVPLEYISIRTDVTALKRSEEALRLHSRALEASYDAISIADARAPDLPLIYVNAAFTSITGYARDEVIGRNCRFLQNGDREQPGLTVLRAALAKGEPARVLIRNYRKDGAYFWNELTVAPVRDEQGRLSHFIGVAADVTARVEAENALKESEAQLRHAQRIAHIGHWEVDFASGALSWSEEIHRIFGTTPERFTPSYDNFYAMVHPDDVALVKASEWACMETGRHDVVHRIVRPDGTIRWVHELAEQVRGEDGEPCGLRGTVQDVTERIEAQQQLLQFRAALDASPDGIYIIDRDSMRFIDCNASAAASLGYEREELLKLGPLDVKPQTDRARLAELFDRVLAPGGAVVHYETLHWRKDGSTFPVEIALRGVVFQGRRIVTAVARDISERKRAEYRLRQSEAHLREAHAIARLGNWKLNLNNGLFDWSEEVYTLLGREHSASPPTLAEFYAQVAPEDVPRLKAAQAAAMSTREVQAVDVRIRLPEGGVRWLRLQGKGQFDSAGNATHISGTVQDIHAEKTREAELERAREEAERANRAKSEFLSRMSHELRTPMNAILGFAQLLQLNPALDEGSRANVKEITEAGHHLLELINEVLDLARIESGRLSLDCAALDCKAVVEECVALVLPLARVHGVEILRAEGAAGLYAWADRTRVKQVLLNLLSNAVKYNRPDGRVTLRVAAAGADAVRFEVSDTGSGIAPERQDELFEPFHRLVARGSPVQGTGIGLAISKRLVEAMGGAIGCESRLGIGSEFWFTLPRAAAAVPAATPAAPVAAPATSAAAGCVLYIEDNGGNVRLMQSLLARLPDVELVVATTPEAGLRLARERSVRLVLLDINLPGMDGFQVLARLRADGSNATTPVVAVSADAMPEQIERARLAGFDDYVTKPIDTQRLLALVTHYLRRDEVENGSA